MSGNVGFELRNAPSDGVSSLSFASTNDTLLASSWDCSLRLYNARDNKLLQQFQDRAPLLDAVFSSDDATAFCAGLGRTIKAVDLASGTESLLGSHDDAVKSLLYNAETSLVYSGSWDASVRMWDRRSSSSSPIASCALPGKVYSMCMWNNLLVVATSGRHIHIYDVRNMSEPEQRRESSLKHQTRAVAAFPDGKGYVLSSIEGRVAVEYFDPKPDVQAHKYAFKCHRSKEPNGRAIIFPVNAIAFHPILGTFATGGDDGLVSIWDGENRKRIRQLPAYPTSISDLAFSRGGDLLAVASSYTFSEGERDHPNDAIFVRQVDDTDVRPRVKRAE